MIKFYPDNSNILENLEHYSYHRVLSFALRFIWIIGARGYGKTYGLKTMLFSNFVKHGKKFAWCRTTEKALDKIRNADQFFGRMKNLEALGVKEYAIKGSTIYINGQIAGYFFPIATFYNSKGADYDVDTIVWDEFMRAKGERAIPNKLSRFYDLVESIGRDNASRIIGLSNSTNLYDESISQYGIHINDYGCYVMRDRNACIHYCRPSKRYIEESSQRLSGSAMSQEDFNFAFGNKFTDFGDYGKESNARYLYSLQVDDNKFLSLYYSNERIYIKPNKPADPIIKSNDNIYVNNTVHKLVTADKRLLKQYHDRGKITFFDGYCRDMFQNILPA